VDEHELGALVGRWARLRPADGEPVVRDGHGARTEAGLAMPGADWVEVAVISNLDEVLRCETRDRRAAALGGRPVYMELGLSEAMLRLPGKVRVMGDHPTPVVLAVSATGPLEHLQRRQWVRAQTSVPVELLVDARHGGGVFRTTTLDLSGGGARVKLVGPMEVGELVHLTFWLPEGPLEVAGTVLDATTDGSLRVAFEQVPESVSKRLVRFAFDVQLHRRSVDH